MLIKEAHGQRALLGLPRQSELFDKTEPTLSGMQG